MAWTKRTFNDNAGPEALDAEFFNNFQDSIIATQGTVESGGGASGLVAVDLPANLPSTSVAVGDMRYVRGRLSVGDGGGGIFRCSSIAALQSTNDGGVNFVVGAQSDGSRVRWTRDIRKSEPINARWFGVVADANLVARTGTDNTAAFQAAHDAAHDNGQGYGTSVYVPRGYYLTGNLQWQWGVMLRGETWAGTVLAHKDGQATPVITVLGADTGGEAVPSMGFSELYIQGATLTTDLIYFNGRSDNGMHMDNMALMGDERVGSTVETNGINMQDYVNFHPTRIRFDALGGYGIKIRGPAFFPGGMFSITHWTYDNGNNARTRNGLGIFYMDSTALEYSRGTLHFGPGKIEINKQLSTSHTGLIRHVNNTTYSTYAQPQVRVNFTDMELTYGALTAAERAGSRLISCQSGEVGVLFHNVTLHGVETVYDNDTQSSKDPIYGNRDDTTTFGFYTPHGHQAFDNPQRNIRPLRFAGVNVDRTDSVFSLTDWRSEQGDFALSLFPNNNGANFGGRVFAWSAVQDDAGRHKGHDQTGSALALGTASITTGTANLNFTAALDSEIVPGTTVSVPGAGASGATLVAVVKSVDMSLNRAVLKTNASTTVSGAAITAARAKVMAVPLVSYGTAAPTAGTWKAADLVINTTPASGGVVGWVCTVAGTPGTWVEFGKLEGGAATDTAASGAVTLTTASSRLQRFTGTFTANRTITLPASGLFVGDTFEIVRRQSSGTIAAFTLAVGSVSTIPASFNAFVKTRWNGSAWELSGGGFLNTVSGTSTL